MNFVYLTSRFLEFIQPDLSRLSLTGEGTRAPVAPGTVMPLTNSTQKESTT
jgi:hypothetical protein